jgi:hypothetical protein
MKVRGKGKRRLPFWLSEKAAEVAGKKIVATS